MIKLAKKVRCLGVNGRCR